MNHVSIEAESAEIDYGSALHMGGRYIRLGLRLTESQRRDAIVGLLSEMTTDDASALLRSEFPELFEVTA